MAHILRSPQTKTVRRKTICLKDFLAHLAIFCTPGYWHGNRYKLACTYTIEDHYGNLYLSPIMLVIMRRTYVTVGHSCRSRQRDVPGSPGRRSVWTGPWPASGLPACPASGAGGATQQVADRGRSDMCKYSQLFVASKMKK